MAKLFKRIKNEWNYEENGEQLTYRLLYISDKEQYIVYSNGVVEKFLYPYSMQQIKTICDDWVEVPLKDAFTS